MAAEAPVAQAIQQGSKEEGFKVFVGNLAFATTPEDLKTLFSQSGDLLDAQIIHRGTRSLGYGFITYATEEAATKAISANDKSEVAGRVINVELAKPPQAKAVAEDAAAAASGDASDKPKSKRKPRKPRADADTEEAGDAAPAEANGESKPRAPRNRRRGAAGATEGGEAAAPAAAAEGAEKKPRAARERKGPPEGEPSKTLTFVSNLAFTVDDEALKTAFDGYEIKNATVVTTRFGKFKGRSKGFAFVDFASEAEQQRAIKELPGKEIAGRNISIKVAIEGSDKPKDAAPSEPEPEAQIVAS